MVQLHHVATRGRHTGKRMFRGRIKGLLFNLWCITDEHEAALCLLTANHIKTHIGFNILMLYSRPVIQSEQRPGSASSNAFQMIGNADCEPDLFTLHHCQTFCSKHKFSLVQKPFKTPPQSLGGHYQQHVNDCGGTKCTVIHIQLSGAYLPPSNIMASFDSRRLKTLTFPKYLSNNSTYLCSTSRVSSSLSWSSRPAQKYKLAYLQDQRGQAGERSLRCFMTRIECVCSATL